MQEEVSHSGPFIQDLVFFLDSCFPTAATAFTLRMGGVVGRQEDQRSLTVEQAHRLVSLGLTFFVFSLPKLSQATAASTRTAQPVSLVGVFSSGNEMNHGDFLLIEECQLSLHTEYVNSQVKTS